MARGPGEVYSWDITKLRGPLRGVWYDLYVMLDIFSRYVVGWLVAETETAELATEFIDDVIRVYGKPKVVHADRGTSMTSKSVAQLLIDLDVARSHSRPHVSNDNPDSEAAFKTLKYCPASPTTSTTSTTPARSAKSSSTTTTTSTTTPGSDCTPPRPSTSEPPGRSAPNARPSSPPPTRVTPSSSTGAPNRPSCRPWPGSTHPATPPNYRTTDNSVSQNLTGSAPAVTARRLAASTVDGRGQTNTPSPSRQVAPARRPPPCLDRDSLSAVSVPPVVSNHFCPVGSIDSVDRFRRFARCQHHLQSPLLPRP